jgi:hypothetical protein
MDSVKDAVAESVTFESLFDDNTAVVSKAAMKQEVFKKLMATGEPMTIDLQGDESADLIVRKMSPPASQGYNVFENMDEYQDWMRQSLHEPTEDEIMEGLRENGAGT